METLVMVLAAMAAMAAQMGLVVLTLTMLVNLIPTQNGAKTKRTGRLKRLWTSLRNALRRP